MLTSVKLQGMFSYSVYWFLVFEIGFIFLLSVILYIFIKYRLSKKPKKRIKVKKEVSGEALAKAKAKYSKALNRLRKKYHEKNMKDRKAYEQLSRVIRRFAYEVTGINVTNYTLEEIRPLNMEQLTMLVELCYPPEFGPQEDGYNFEHSIDMAEMVVQRWN